MRFVEMRNLSTLCFLLLVKLLQMMKNIYLLGALLCICLCAFVFVFVFTIFCWASFSAFFSSSISLALFCGAASGSSSSVSIRSFVVRFSSDIENVIVSLSLKSFPLKLKKYWHLISFPLTELVARDTE